MNAQPAGEIILYQRGDAPAIDVRLDGDTVWMNQQQLADLFQTSRTNVVEHIAKIYAEGELSQEATGREFRQVRTEFRAMNNEPTHMKNWLAYLTQLITAIGSKTLQGAGMVSHQDALAHAQGKYAKFCIQQAGQPSDVEAVFLETVKKVQKKIEGKRLPATSRKKGGAA